MWIQTVIDIWANKGQSIKRWTKILWDNTYFHCFEPLKEPYDMLVEKFWKSKKIKLYNTALWSVHWEKEIFISNINDSSSLLEPTQIMKETYTNIHFDRTDVVKINTLDAIYPWLDIHGHVLMKIDTQWFEWDVLKWSVSSLAEISIIVLELSFVELYTNQPLFHDIYAFLTDHWFVYKWSFEQSGDPVDGKPLQQDAIFVNTNM